MGRVCEWDVCLYLVSGLCVLYGSMRYKIGCPVSDVCIHVCPCVICEYVL